MSFIKEQYGIADEARKIMWESVPYFHGKVLDIGLTRYKTFPHWIGCGPNRDIKIKDADELSLFAGGSCEGVFSAFFLDKVSYSEVPKFLTEWVRVIKPGGHLMLYLPDAALFPRDLDKDHLWDVTYDKLVSAMDELKAGWDLCDYQVRNDENEYGLWFVFQIRSSSGHSFSHRNPKPEKTCAVIRLGAFGDVIQASSILPHLKEQGYHITFFCSDHGYPVIQRDPHIDRFVIQGPGEVPPQYLGEFWDYTEKKYDRWINLSESVECTLLAAQDHSNFYWPNEVRAKYQDRNYLEFTHELAQVPPPYKAKFYSTFDEREWARFQKRKFGKLNILWSLSGSSVHKTWPHLDAVVARLLVEYPESHIILVGDEVSQMLEAGWARPEGVPENPRVHCRSGKWTIRQSMAFAEVADLVIGCETGLLNAAGMMETPKIVTLSHSSEHMLCKHWKNYIALSQPQGVGCAKQPCRQLHRDWSACLRDSDQGGSAACQHEITPVQMWGAVTRFLGEPQRMVA